MPDPETEYKVYMDGCLHWEVRHSFHEEALFEVKPERWVGLKQTVIKGDELQAERIALLHILHQEKGQRRFYVCNQFFHNYSSSDTDICVPCPLEAELGSRYGGCWCRFGGRISILFFILLYC